MPSSLRLATFNAENFSLLIGPVATRSDLESLSDDDYRALNPSIYYPNKDRAKVAAIAALIRDANLDVVGLCEAGGLETLQTFNRLYLDDAYECYLHEENSRRGIYVGALVRRDRFPWVRAENMRGSFSRNVLRLSVGLDRGGLQIFVVHLKSQYGQDFGLEHRVREIQLLTELVRPQRCIVMGDFNGIAIRGEAQFEYEPFLELPFRDVLEAVGVPTGSRRTHYYFGPEPHFTQLDYLFVSNDLTVHNGGVVEGAIPLNKEQREYLPSDHLMVWAELSDRPTLSKPTTAATTKKKRNWWQRLRAWLRRP